MPRPRRGVKLAEVAPQFEPTPLPNRLVNPRGRVFESVLDLAGGMPLVKLPRLKDADGLHADLALKLEFFNPLGSVKDRIGLAMVEAAELVGEIAPGKATILPSSGNTGIALAVVAAAKSYKLIVVMPEGASVERRKLLAERSGRVDSCEAGDAGSDRARGLYPQQNRGRLDRTAVR